MGPDGRHARHREARATSADAALGDIRRGRCGSSHGDGEQQAYSCADGEAHAQHGSVGARLSPAAAAMEAPSGAAAAAAGPTAAFAAASAAASHGGADLVCAIRRDGLLGRRSPVIFAEQDACVAGCTELR